MMHQQGSDGYVSGHGHLSYGVEHYDLALTYSVSGNRLDARATLTVVAAEALHRVELDLHHLNVHKVFVDGSPAKHQHRRGRLSVRLAEELPEGGSCTVTVQYSGQPQPLRKRHHGSAGWEELTDGVIVASQPHGAPSWFPCNDRTSDKATYSFEITTSSDYTVVANGVLEGRTRHSRTTTWRYEMAHPMAPYLATLQIGKYDLIDLEDAVVPTSIAAPHHLRGRLDDAFGDQADMIAFFQRTFGPYPFDTYAVVVTEDDLEIPLESQGLSTFGANLVRPDWDAVRLVAHELSHQWFGNSVTAAHLRDIWLHEGFACYSEWLWSEESGGQTADEQARLHWEKLDGLDQDVLLADPGPDLMFDDRVYKRGALLLHSLRLTVGDKEFFALLREWVAHHAYGTVSTEDFTGLVEQRVGDGVAPLFDAWLREQALPPLP